MLKELLRHKYVFTNIDLPRAKASKGSSNNDRPFILKDHKKNYPRKSRVFDSVEFHRNYTILLSICKFITNNINFVNFHNDKGANSLNCDCLYCRIYIDVTSCWCKGTQYNARFGDLKLYLFTFIFSRLQSGIQKVNHPFTSSNFLCFSLIII